MSLATRCPSCGTVFRVVLDQLRISAGWVRCGRCNGVFDAAEVLFDIDLGTPVYLDLSPASAPLATDPAPATGEPTGLPGPPPAARVPPASPAPAAAAGSASGRAEPDEPLVVTDWAVPPTAQAAGTPPWAGPAQRIEPSFDGTGPDADRSQAGPAAPLLRRAAQAEEDEGHSVDAAPMAPTGSPAAATSAGGLARVEAPARFLQAAERAARWRQPRVRAGLWAGLGLLALTATLQAALLGRDLLAARAPATAPALRSLCAALGCQVQAPRRIEALAVESSALGRLDAAGLYRLSLALRNRADIALQAPALELSLTNGQGQLVSRRVLGLAELGLTGGVLPAGQAVTLQALLSAGEQRIDGYTVELFYP